MSTEAKAKWCTYCLKADHDDSECWCTRAENHRPRQIIGTMFTAFDEAPGFHKVELPILCKHSEHFMPSMLHIPAGTKYVHYCPACRYKSVAFGAVVDC